ncbi:MAG TPA: sulfotransferase [Solirubrobacterales bacterium]
MAERPATNGARPLTFVGGTGRSGTHVIASLLDRHSRYHSVPIECRFHTNPQGFPDLLEGRVTKEQFLRKLKRFWWYRIRAGEPLAAVLPKLPLGRQTRGLHKVVPRERFDAAVLAFDGAYEDDPRAACRALFLELLMPLADEAGKPGLVEMSCFTVAQAPTLVGLFGEAKIVHTVRDGRDAGSSKVAKRQKREHPRDARQGVEWWAGRLAEAEAGARAVPAEKLLTISLDELVGGEREASYARLLEFLEIADEPPMREFFETEMTPENAHRDRWREGLSEPEQAEVASAYEQALDRIAGEGYLSAPLLRRAYERFG